MFLLERGFVCISCEIVIFPAENLIPHLRGKRQPENDSQYIYFFFFFSDRAMVGCPRLWQYLVFSSCLQCNNWSTCKLAQAAYVRQACLCAPGVLVCAMHNCVAWPLLSPTFGLLFLRLLLFFYEKNLFFGRFFCFLQPAFSHGRLGHPQSLEY